MADCAQITSVEQRQDSDRRGVAVSRKREIGGQQLPQWPERKAE